MRPPRSPLLPREPPPPQAACGPAEDVCKGESSVSHATPRASSRRSFPAQLVGPGTRPGDLRARPSPPPRRTGSPRPHAGESLAGPTSCRAASGFPAQVAIPRPLTRSSSRLRPSTPCLPAPALGKRSFRVRRLPRRPPHTAEPQWPRENRSPLPPPPGRPLGLGSEPVSWGPVLCGLRCGVCVVPGHRGTPKPPSLPPILLPPAPRRGEMVAALWPPGPWSPRPQAAGRAPASRTPPCALTRSKPPGPRAPGGSPACPAREDSDLSAPSNAPPPVPVGPHPAPGRARTLWPALPSVSASRLRLSRGLSTCRSRRLSRGLGTLAVPASPEPAPLTVGPREGHGVAAWAPCEQPAAGFVPGAEHLR